MRSRYGTLGLLFVIAVSCTSEGGSPDPTQAALPPTVCDVVPGRPAAQVLDTDRLFEEERNVDLSGDDVFVRCIIKPSDDLAAPALIIELNKLNLLETRFPSAGKRPVVRSGIKIDTRLGSGTIGRYRAWIYPKCRDDSYYLMVHGPEEMQGSRKGIEAIVRALVSAIDEAQDCNEDYGGSTPSSDTEKR